MIKTLQSLIRCLSLFYLFLILNFGHWYLFEICFLMLGIIMNFKMDLESFKRIKIIKA